MTWLYHNSIRKIKESEEGELIAADDLDIDYHQLADVLWTLK